MDLIDQWGCGGGSLDNVKAVTRGWQFFPAPKMFFLCSQVDHLSLMKRNPQQKINATEKVQTDSSKLLVFNYRWTGFV